MMTRIDSLALETLRANVKSFQQADANLADDLDAARSASDKVPVPEAFWVGVGYALLIEVLMVAIGVAIWVLWP